jgi:hypothetical protein
MPDSQSLYLNLADDRSRSCSRDADLSFTFNSLKEVSITWQRSEPVILCSNMKTISVRCSHHGLKNKENASSGEQSMLLRSSPGVPYSVMHKLYFIRSSWCYWSVSIRNPRKSPYGTYIKCLAKSYVIRIWVAYSIPNGGLIHCSSVWVSRRTAPRETRRVPRRDHD